MVNLAHQLHKPIALLPQPEVLLLPMLSVLSTPAQLALQLLDKPPHALPIHSAPLVPLTKLPMLREYATPPNALPPMVLALPTSKDAQPMVSVRLYLARSQTKLLSALLISVNP